MNSTKLTGKKSSDMSFLEIPIGSKALKCRRTTTKFGSEEFHLKNVRKFKTTDQIGLNIFSWQSELMKSNNRHHTLLKLVTNICEVL